MLIPQKKVFDNMDLRGYIFNFIYPKKIRKGMIIQYQGSIKPKPCMYFAIGKIYKIENVYIQKWNSVFKYTIVVFAKGLDSQNIIFFPEYDDIIKLLKV